MGLFDRLKKKQQAEAVAASVPAYPELTAIAKYLDDKQIKYLMDTTDTMQQLSVVIVGDNGKKQTYAYLCNGKSGTLVVGFISREIPGRSIDAVKELMNHLNTEYQYFKLTYDEKKRLIQASYQMPMCVDNPGEVAFEILLRMSNVFEDVTAAVNRMIP